MKSQLSNVRSPVAMPSEVAVVRPLAPFPDPISSFERLSRLPGCVFFDSALPHSTLGRFSFLSADPFDVIDWRDCAENAFPALHRKLQRFAAPAIPGLPPFQGGMAGVFSYDLNRTLENIPAPRFNEFHTPLLSLGLYDVVVAWDHELEQAWIISQGFPETDPSLRHRRALQRADEFCRLLSEPACERGPSSSTHEIIPSDQLAPQSPVSDMPGLTSNFSADEYLQAIQTAVDYIWAGDIFQVNLAQRLLHPAVRSSVDLYRTMRQVNPAPFSGFYSQGRLQVISASPERLFAVRRRHVETRPIKGTRRRTGFPESDLVSGYELMSSAKDRAENVMIVDLLRNDLSRCCHDDSIEVTQLCGLERFPTVLHLVSAIQGRLRDDCSLADLWTAIYPGGSVTGAPKVRAMEIIAELEPTTRGPYCGSLAYWGFDGTADASILIRTITAAGGWWQIPVGGGIVAQSDPQREYDETWAKASGMLRAIDECAR